MEEIKAATPQEALINALDNRAIYAAITRNGKVQWVNSNETDRKAGELDINAVYRDADIKQNHKIVSKTKRPVDNNGNFTFMVSKSVLDDIVEGNRGNIIPESQLTPQIIDFYREDVGEKDFGTDDNPKTYERGNKETQRVILQDLRDEFNSLNVNSAKQTEEYKRLLGDLILSTGDVRQAILSGNDIVETQVDNVNIKGGIMEIQVMIKKLKDNGDLSNETKEKIELDIADIMAEKDAVKRREKIRNLLKQVVRSTLQAKKGQSTTHKAARENQKVLSIKEQINRLRALGDKPPTKKKVDKKVEIGGEIAPAPVPVPTPVSEPINKKRGLTPYNRFIQLKSKELASLPKEQRGMKVIGQMWRALSKEEQSKI